MELTKFQQKVYKLLRKIPKGKITTYKILAKAAGKPKNWRQIGRVLSQNLCPQNYADPPAGGQTNADSQRKSALSPRQSAMRISCYKVIRSSGEIGGYSQGVDKKKKLLQKDGIMVYNNRVEDFKKHLFKF